MTHDTTPEVFEEESARPIGSQSLLMCARHNNLQHRHEVVPNPEQHLTPVLLPGVWRCIDPEPTKERLFEDAGQ